MIYFAYGANIDPQQMRLRCRAARAIGPAWLAGYRLCFPRYSFIRQSALASIEEAADESVWGALYEIGDDDLKRVDACEGYYVVSDPGGNPYNRVEVDIRYKEGDRARAFTYIANPMAYGGEPSHDYLSQIARCGAALGFPDDYVEKILSLIPVRGQAA